MACLLSKPLRVAAPAQGHPVVPNRGQERWLGPQHAGRPGSRHRQDLQGGAGRH